MFFSFFMIRSSFLCYKLSRKIIFEIKTKTFKTTRKDFFPGKFETRVTGHDSGSTGHGSGSTGHGSWRYGSALIKVIQTENV